MKKILSLLVVFALVISTVPAVFAATTPVIYLEAKTDEGAMQVGSTIEINVRSNSKFISSVWSEMFSYQLVVEFDEDMLKATGAESALGEDAGITHFVADNEAG